MNTETEVSFIDTTRVNVVTKDGTIYVLTFPDNYHYQLETRFDHYFTKLLAQLFDKYYDGTVNSVWGEINRQLLLHKCNMIFMLGVDKNQERKRLGERIKQIREQKHMDAKTLAEKSGIDAANLSRIEAGRYSAGFDILVRIATALGMKIDFVELKGNENEN